MRKNVSTNTPSENEVGYSRAVLINNTMYVSGTTSVDEKGKVIGTTVYKQAQYIFEKIQQALNSEGFLFTDVVSVTAYLVHMKKSKEFDKAFKEHFFDIKPCCTLVGVKELPKHTILIEISCVAEKSL